MEFLASLQDSPLGLWVIESAYAHPVLLIFHALGMAAVVGVVFAFDARVLGYAKGIPVTAFESMLPIAWAGFAVNAASGVLLFASNGPRLITNWTFQLKIALIVAGGLAVWLLWRRIRARQLDPAGFDGISGADKTTAAVSVLFWIGALVSGRLIAYTLALSRY